MLTFIIVSYNLAEIIRNLFRTIRYSEQGSNERKKEELTYIFFVNYLEEYEEEYEEGM